MQGMNMPTSARMDGSAATCTVGTEDEGLSHEESPVKAAFSLGTLVHLLVNCCASLQ